jgi:hypothetical protein
MGKKSKTQKQQKQNVKDAATNATEIKVSD